ncbi:hypothetical protein P167DRAFT_548618 [Morchella conica CCBAS932]|uniref:Uncharacterized protein n=1 Tax=Morchella conica CCBAS932 TaxID=1392247 RepID=A0A3N4KKJ8_9PEZI|nr:hypothetical protein P167DRAFT_548618 [Morchella conica CCBAS932]
MSTSNNPKDKVLDTRFLEITPDKEQLSVNDQGSTDRLSSDDQLDDQLDSSPLARKSTGVGSRLAVLPLRFTLPSASPVELKEHPAQDALVQPEVTDRSNEFEIDLSAPPTSINQEVTLGLNHIIDTDNTGAFYEDTLAFDHCLFGEIISTASTPLSTSLVGIVTQSFDNYLFNFISTTDAQEIEVSLAIPQNTERVELFDWAQRYGIDTSDDCFIDLLSVVRAKPVPIEVVRGIKRSASKEFVMPAAKTICKEVRKCLAVAPKRKAGPADKKHRPRVVQISVWPRRTTAKASWTPVRIGR